MRYWLLFLLCFQYAAAEEKVTAHSIKIGEESLNYTATVSSGKVSYIAYVKESEENRPITFVFNGGPGSSSVWLHLGAFGPRIFVGPEEGGSKVPPYKTADNLDTILDLTDLVFIDPPGTGLSPDEEESYSIQKDIRVVGDFIREYLTQNGRWNSPKYIAGESYGAGRAIGITDYLLNQYGVYFNGVLLISAAIDAQLFVFDYDNQLPYFLYLPTYATTAWHHQKAHAGLSLEEVAQKAREFAYTTYAPSLICPKCSDRTAIYPQIAEMIGFSPEEIEEHQGKITDDHFCDSLLKDQRQLVSRMDGRTQGHRGRYDPGIAQIEGAMAATLHQYLHRELDFKSSYIIFSEKANNQWNFFDHNRWGYPSLMDSMRRTLTSNPSMKIFVGCGYFDLATPFATAEYFMDHLDIPNLTVQMEYYDGGHMYYTNPQARAKFKQDLTRFYKE